MVRLRNFKETLIENLKDQTYAQTYLDIALEAFEQDQNIEAFLTALRDVTEAQGGVSQLAQRTQLNRPHLYRALSRKGNPSLYNVDKILHGLGFRLTITPIKGTDLSNPPQSGASQEKVLSN